MSWLISALLLGWLIVYNILRFAGGAPSEVAAQALLGGIALGLVGFGALLLARRQLARSGRLTPRGPAVVPEPDRLSDDQRNALRAAGPFVALLAAAGVGMGVFLGALWIQDSPEDRAATMLILALWNLLIGAWLSDEYVRMRRFEGEGMDAVGLGGIVTAVLASVGLARDMAALGQLALIVLAAATAALAYFAFWRLTGAGDRPLDGRSRGGHRHRGDRPAARRLRRPVGRVRLICPLCEAVVADADVLAPGVCPDCGARYEGDGESAPAAVATALPALGADGLDAERVAHALFSVDPARCRALGVGITSDERDGFYRWWGLQRRRSSRD